VTSRRSRAGGVVAVCALLGVLWSLGGGGAASADDSSQGGGNVSVTVDDGSTPTPSASSTESSTTPGGGDSGTGSLGSGSSGSGAGGGATSGGSSVPGTTTTTTSTSGGAVVGGVLYMSGLESQGKAAANPAEGSVILWFSLRNISQSSIDATVRFWMTNPLGGELDAADVAVTGLKPGAIQVVTTELHGVGQWGFVNAHATLTPPETIDGVQVGPVTRDAVAFVFPWLGATGVIAIGGSVLAWYVVRRIFAAPLPVSAT
jgi:hypothetical protein